VFTTQGEQSPVIQRLTSSEHVHQEYDAASLAALMTSSSGFRLPCGDCALSDVWMSTQHTKWCEPAAQGEDYQRHDRRR